MIADIKSKSLNMRTTEKPTEEEISNTVELLTQFSQETDGNEQLKQCVNLIGVDVLLECSMVAATVSAQLLEETVAVVGAMATLDIPYAGPLQDSKLLRAAMAYIKMNYRHVYENLRKRHLVPSTTSTGDQNEYNDTHERFELIRLNFLRLVPAPKDQHLMEEEGTTAGDYTGRAKAILDKHFYMFVQGSAFSGKTRLLNSFLELLGGGKEIIKVDINRSVETLSLVGNYVLKSENGQKKFEWLDGPMVRLLRSGGVLVLENLEMATDELKAFIKHFLLTDHVKVRNKKIYRDASFRLIITSRQRMDMQTDNTTIKLADKTQSMIIAEHITRYFGEAKDTRFVSRLMTILLEEYDSNSCTKRHIRFVKRCVDSIGQLQLQPNGEPKFISTTAKLAIVFDIMDVYCDGQIDKLIESGSYAPICAALRASEQEVEVILRNYSLDITSKGPHGSTRFPIQLTFNQPSSSFVYTHKNAVELEKIAGCIYYQENILLVGETGAGKTAIVQELARMTGTKLHVFNLSESTDASDLFGGYKPVNRSSDLDALVGKLEEVNGVLFSTKKNAKFFGNLRSLITEQKHKVCLKCIQQLAERFLRGLQNKESEVAASLQEILKETNELLVHGFAKDMSFEFVKGMLWKAIEKGEWVLLDEVNLAPEEVLLRLEQVLSSDRIYLTEANDIRILDKPKSFRIFACMNPAFEVGKKPLPPLVEESFTRIEFEPIESFDEVYRILKGLLADFPIVTDKYIQHTARIYIALKERAANNEVLDKSDKKCVFSLRQLKRAIGILKASVDNPLVQLSTAKAIYMSLRVAFMLDLNESGRKMFNNLFNEVFEISAIETTYKQENYINLKAEVKESNQYSVIYNHPFKSSGQQVAVSDRAPYHGDYSITPTIKENMFDLLRILMFTKETPLLLEGPTSTGKTSVVKFLADMTGNTLVRINNHRDMDLDEYVGRYEPKGHSVEFIEGKLLECMRNGYWLLLDELNLARSEILEALNRVFDDNRELYVPELGEFVKPAPAFRIFATQNPANYSGRGLLSKAFKNRFICVNWDNLKDVDLEQILGQRCQLPKSRSTLLLAIKNQLQNLRSHDELLEGKHGLITVRDLLKWSLRATGTKEEVVLEGYSLLAERIREFEQREIVQTIMKEHAQVRVLDIRSFYTAAFKQLLSQYPIGDIADSMSIKLTDEFMKTIVLITKSYLNKESVLLVGETGTGKTTIAQFMAKMLGLEFHSLNCHKGTEVSDFLGGWRPVRQKAQISAEIKDVVSKYIVDEAEVDELSDDAAKLHSFVESNRASLQPEDMAVLEGNLAKLDKDFEWVDGSLVEAVKKGGVYLVDEISLASDNVLERLNSLLESDRKLMLRDGEIQAHPSFMMIATMNPSGDHGKRELSPALRNRFTEVWVPSPLDAENFGDEELSTKAKNYLKSIIEAKILGSATREFIDLVVDMVYSAFRITNYEQRDLFKPLNLRDLENLYYLINSNGCTESSLGLAIDMVFESSIGLIRDESLRTYALALKAEFFKGHPSVFACLSQTKVISIDSTTGCVSIENVGTKVDPNQLHILNDYILDERYVTENLFRILLGLQSNKALLLEGPPGVGKTSLIQTLARLKNVPLYRINMSEQTDIIDLLGTDVPDADKIGAFKWSDGVLLRALKEGGWVIIDELNLANQTVLEGLNSILDYRGEVYLPDLNLVVKKHPEFRFFGTQNPDDFGKGRKGLPLSFLNRFFRIYIEETPLEAINKILQRIVQNCYPQLTAFDNFFTFVFGLVEKTILDPIVFNIRFFRKLLQFLDRYYAEGNRELVQWMAYVIFVVNFEHDSDKRETLQDLYQRVFGAAPVYFTCAPGSVTVFGESNQRLTLRTRGNLYNMHPMPDYLEYELLYSLNTVIDLNMPLIITTESKEKAILQTLTDMSKVSGKRIRMMQLYKTADNADLVGGYDQSYALEEFGALIKRIEKLGDTETSRTLKEHRDVDPKQLVAILESVLESIQSPKTYSLIETYAYNLAQGQPIFEWVDSELLKAIEHGDWIVIKGCDRVSSSVLEKLNGLLEDEEILVNECMEHNEVRRVKKNSEFRIFLLFKHAQHISNALKNRCVLVNLDNFGFDSVPLRSYQFDSAKDTAFARYMLQNRDCDYTADDDSIERYNVLRFQLYEVCDKLPNSLMSKPGLRVEDTSRNFVEYQFCRFLQSLVKLYRLPSSKNSLTSLAVNSNGISEYNGLPNTSAIYTELSDVLGVNLDAAHSLNPGTSLYYPDRLINKENLRYRSLSYLNSLIDVVQQQICLDTPSKHFLSITSESQQRSCIAKGDFVKQLRFLTTLDPSIMGHVSAELAGIRNELSAMAVEERTDYAYSHMKNIALQRLYDFASQSSTIFLQKSANTRSIFFTYIDGEYNESRNLYVSTDYNDQLLAALMLNPDVLSFNDLGDISLLIQDKFENVYVFAQLLAKLINVHYLSLLEPPEQYKACVQSVLNYKAGLEKQKLLKEICGFRFSDFTIVEFNVLKHYIGLIQRYVKVRNQELLSSASNVQDDRAARLNLLLNELNERLHVNHAPDQHVLPEVLRAVASLAEKDMGNFAALDQQVARGFISTSSELELKARLGDIQVILHRLESVVCGLPSHRVTLTDRRLQNEAVSSFDGFANKALDEFADMVLSTRTNTHLQSLRAEIIEFVREAKETIASGSSIEWLRRSFVSLFIRFIEKYQLVFDSFNLMPVFKELVEVIFGDTADGIETPGSLLLASPRCDEPLEASLAKLFYLSEFVDITDPLVTIIDQTVSARFETLTRYIDVIRQLDSKKDRDAFTDEGRLLKLKDNLNKMSNFEYSKESVDRQRQEEQRQINERFNTYKEDFSDFIKQADFGARHVETEIKSASRCYNEEAMEILTLLCLKALKTHGIDLKAKADWISCVKHAQMGEGQLSARLQALLINKELESKVAGINELDRLMSGVEIRSKQPSDAETDFLLNFSKDTFKGLLVKSFYMDTSDYQPIASLQSLLRRLMEPLLNLMGMPELSQMPALGMALKIVEKISSFKVRTPLSKLCTAMEIVYHSLVELNAMLPRELKLAKYEEETLKMMNELRKVEKREWRNMLALNLQQLAVQDLPKFLQIKTMMEDSPGPSIVGVIDEFILKSCLSNFRLRLFCVREYAPSIGSLEVRTMVCNLVSYYIQFVPAFERRVKETEAEVEDPMNKLMKITNWYFEDFVNLKMNVEKLYRGINRCIKKQGEVFSEGYKTTVLDPLRKSNIFNDASSLLTHLDKEILYKQKGDEIIATAQLNAIKAASPVFEVEDVSYFRILSPNKLYKLLAADDSLNLSGVGFRTSFVNTDELKGFINSYMTRMHDLKETNNRSFKLRALTDFIKDISLYVKCTRIIPEKSFTYKNLFARFELEHMGRRIDTLFSGSRLRDKYSKRLEKINLRTCMTIDAIRHISENVMYSSEIPKTHQERMLAILFETFMNFGDNYSRLNGLADKIDRLLELEASKAEKVKKTKGGMLLHLDQLLNARTIEDKPSEHIIRLMALINDDKWKESKAVVAEYANDESLNTLKHQIESVETLLASPLSLPEQARTEADYQQLRRKFKASLLKIEQNGELDVFARELRFGDIAVKYASKLIEYSCAPSHLGSQAAELLKYDLLGKLVHTIDWLYNMNKLVYFIAKTFTNLLYSGFCTKPDDPENDKCDSGDYEKELGTGMGDGKGEENVTGEMEYEEQLLGLKNDQQEEQEKDQQDEAKDKEGEKEEEMEMENDFEGDKEDGLDAEEQEKIEPNELDDDIGDVNEEDLNPKLDKGDEDDEEKTEDKNKQSKFELEAQETEKAKEELKAREEQDRDIRQMKTEGQEADSEEEDNEEGKEDSAEEGEEAEFKEEQFNDEAPPRDTEKAEDQPDDLDMDEMEEKGSEHLQDFEEELQEEAADKEEANDEDDRQEEEEAKKREDNPIDTMQLEENQAEIAGNDVDEEGHDNNLGAGDKNEPKEDETQNNQDVDNFKQLVEQKQAELKEQLSKYIEDAKMEKSNNDAEVNMDSKVFEAGESQGYKTRGFAQDAPEKQEDENPERDEPDDDADTQGANRQDRIDKLHDELKKRAIDEAELEVEAIPSESLKRTKTAEERKLRKFSEAMDEFMKTVEPANTRARSDIDALFSESQIYLTKEANRLCEHLKNIIEQRRFAGLKGDYRTGKRINMKRIISYIASNYRKDKIWMRRAEPNQKDYRILLALDNSASMKEKNVGQLALFSFSMLAEAIVKSQVGDLFISSIDSQMNMLYKDRKEWNWNIAADIFAQFDFDYKSDLSGDLSMANFVKQSNEFFGSFNDDKLNMCFIISDGRINKNIVRPYIVEAEQQNYLYFFIILDKEEYSESILNYKTTDITYGGSGVEVSISNYLDDFPFRFYVIVKNIKQLADLVTKVIREYFEKFSN